MLCLPCTGQVWRWSQVCQIHLHRCHEATCVQVFQLPARLPSSNKQAVPGLLRQAGQFSGFWMQVPALLPREPARTDQLTPMVAQEGKVRDRIPKVCLGLLVNYIDVLFSFETLFSACVLPCLAPCFPVHGPGLPMVHVLSSFPCSSFSFFSRYCSPSSPSSESYSFSSSSSCLPRRLFGACARSLHPQVLYHSNLYSHFVPPSLVCLRLSHFPHVSIITLHRRRQKIKVCTTPPQDKPCDSER